MSVWEVFNSTLPFLVIDEEEKEPKLAFILKHIVGLEEDKLKMFVGRLEGQLKVCAACGPAIQNFFQVFRQVSILQKKLSSISGELKGRICQTRDKDGNGLPEYCVWKEVRVEMAADIECNSISNGGVLVCDTIQETGCQPHTPDFSLLTRVQQPVSLESSNLAGKRINGTLAQSISSSSSHFIPQYLSFKKDKRTYYKCSFCPAQYPDLGRMKSHLELHASTSSSISCQLCGWVLGRDKLRFHNARHHPLVSPGSHHHQMPSNPNPPPPSQTFSQLNYAQHRPYTSYKKRTRLYYKCSACPYEIPDLGRMKSHLELHRPGVLVTACGSCGVFLEPEKLPLHNARQHGINKI